MIKLSQFLKQVIEDTKTINKELGITKDGFINSTAFVLAAINGLYNNEYDKNHDYLCEEAAIMFIMEEKNLDYVKIHKNSNDYIKEKKKNLDIVTIEAEEEEFNSLLKELSTAEQDELCVSEVLSKILDKPNKDIKRFVLKYKTVDEDAQSLEDQINDIKWEDLFSDNSKEDTKPKRVSKHTDLEKELDEWLANDELDFIDEEDTNTSEEESKIESISEPAIIDISKKCKELRDQLRSTIFGQDQAIDTFVSGYFDSEIASLTKRITDKPKASFLFTGPSGVGKTFMAQEIARILDLPFKRLDMSSFSDKEANLMLCGFAPTYSGAQDGELTKYLSDHPKSIILFDEIEKAHINVIHIFLQILDSGIVHSNYEKKNISFKDAIVIFTTNAGKKLYNDPTIRDLSAFTKKEIVKALESDINIYDNTPAFPKAICTRFAMGNVIMFNHLRAHNLLSIVKNEFNKYSIGVQEKSNIKITFDDDVVHSILYSEGGKADARTIKGKTRGFISGEIYEFFSLATAKLKKNDITNLNQIEFSIKVPEDEEISPFFKKTFDENILIFADNSVVKKCKKGLSDKNIYSTANLEKAKELLSELNINTILCDVKSGIVDNAVEKLSVDDIESHGLEFLRFVGKNTELPIYILTEKLSDISAEEMISLKKLGVRGAVLYKEKGISLCEQVEKIIEIDRQNNKLLELAISNKVLNFSSEQVIDKKTGKATIFLKDFKLVLSPDTDDRSDLLDDISRPNKSFNDVIGAQDAKEELKYFIKYLKNPKSFLKYGVKQPKGVLLYGPPGTGKTLLAKAMAGESKVTFINTEGNELLRGPGGGAQKIHELFAKARKYAPSIIFIDEIDAISASRSNIVGMYNTDTLTAMVTEMDGFETKMDRPVFVLAATNNDVKNPNIFDPALLRRFDRKILVDLPSAEERKIFINQLISKNINYKISEDQIENIVVRSTNMSLSDLDQVFELSIRLAIKLDKVNVDDECIEEAFESYNNGEIVKWDDSQLLRVCRHEAGHAFISWKTGNTPAYLTVVARGDHGGYMQYGESAQKQIYTKQELLDRIRVSLAGRASEICFYGKEDGISTGAANDLFNATQTATNMVIYYGMDDNIGLSVEKSNDNLSPEIKAKINEILSTEMQNAIDLIEKNKKAINAIVDVLIKKSKMKSDEINKIFKKYSK